MTAVLEVRNIDAGYGPARILHDVSLSVGEGLVHGLVGRNGAGKTTTLQSVYGLPQVTSGSVYVDGEEIDVSKRHAAARKGVAIVPQGRRILPNLTVEENLHLGFASKRSGEWDLKRVYGVFPVLSDRRKSSGMALSGGQQQMLAIGRALLANPRCLLMDEPTEGLAPVLIDEVVEVLRQLKAAGVSICLVEQRVDIVQELADDFTVLVKGEVVAQGRAHQLTSQLVAEHVGVG